MTEPAELRTQRLLLRPFRLTDVDDVQAYAGDKEWSRFLPLPDPYDRVHTEQYIARSFLTNWDVRPTFAIVLDDTVIGGINLTINKVQQSAELGYAIAREQWGNGFASEAARAVVGWGFEAYALAKIIAKANVENEQSWRVMERIGMTREGVLRSYRPAEHDPERRIDMAYYGVLREEWER